MNRIYVTVFRVFLINLNFYCCERGKKKELQVHGYLISINHKNKINIFTHAVNNRILILSLVLNACCTVIHFNLQRNYILHNVETLRPNSFMNYKTDWLKHTSLWKVDVIIKTFDCCFSSSFIPDLLIARLPVLLKDAVILYIKQIQYIPSGPMQ